jgi:hypothetical protein
MQNVLIAALILGLAYLGMCSFSAADAAEKGPLLAHNVYFTLKDNTDAAKKAVVDDCHKLLSPLPGILFYAAGTVSDVERDVIDKDYDVALHCVFESKAAMEKYLVEPKHLEFVAKHKANWKKVRVFDSYVGGAPKGK